MSIEPYRASIIPMSQTISTSPPLIKSDEIKAILYLGIRGEIHLPLPEESVNILA